MLATHHEQKAVQQVLVTEKHAGQRVDNFLLNVLRGVPKSRLYRIIRKGELRVNKKRVAVNYRLVLGDIVRIPPIKLSENPQKTLSFPKKLFDSLNQAMRYEDEQLIILDKPAGLAVHGGSGVSFGLIEALRKMRPDAPFLELVHRLDRDTSGCIMIAKRRSILTYLHDCLKNGKIKKHYQLLVKDPWRGGKVIESPLLKYVLKSGERLVKVDPQGKFARTTIKILESYSDASLLEAIPETGRTHQIRVHCAFMGHPILGDQKYGDTKANKQTKLEALDRLYLHANKLVINLPYRSTELIVTAPLPVEFKNYCQVLRTQR